MIDLKIDKELPYDIELEKVVLGAILMDGEALPTISDFLKPEMFYKDSHKIIYNAILSLDKRNEAIDILTVTNELKSLGFLIEIGGPVYIVNLTDRVGSGGNIDLHCKILAQHFLRRGVINIALKTLQSAFDETIDCFDLADKLISETEKIATFESNDFSPAKRMEETKEAIYKAFNSPQHVSGISTGYKELDTFTGGLCGGDLIVVGGMPGTFKTALGLSISHNAQKAGNAVLIFEQEMSGRQVGMREVAMITNIPTETLKTGKIKETDLINIENAIGDIENRKVFMDLSSGITVGRIKSISKRMKRDNDIGLIVIDYLGLMNLEIKKFGNPESAIDNAVKEIKILAKTLDIPIILLAQFNREAAKNVLETPQMSYFKGSGSIEAHADSCWLLWNPAQFDHKKEFRFEGIDPAGKIAIVHAKNRQGRTGIQWLNVFPETNNFSDLNNETNF